MFEELDDYQRRAVTASLDRHVLVTAPPGSGKTRVLTARYLYLAQQGIDTKSIVAVTFTNKAADEMKQRIASALGISQEAVRKLPIATFHSLALRWLRQNISYVDGYAKNFTIYDESQVQAVLRRYIAKHQIPADPATLASAIGRLQESGIFPEDCIGNISHELYSIARNHALHPQSLAEYYRDYVRMMRGANAMDFDMIILNAIRLLEKKPADQLGIRYVLVDECQDINYAQYMLLYRLASGNALLFLTGDVDQSLYSFRGSRPELIEQFIAEFDPEQHRLVYNYRSCRAIVDAASQVIEPNYRDSNMVYKPMQAVKDGGLLKWYNLDPLEQTVSPDEFITKLVSGLVEFAGYSYSDVAVLCRYSKPLLPIRSRLIANKVPVYIAIPRYALKTVVKSFILFLANPRDHLSLTEILSALKHVGEKTVAKVRDYLIGTGELEDLPKKLQEASKLKGINKKARASIEAFADALRMVVNGLFNAAGSMADVLEPAILKLESVLPPDEIKAEDLQVLVELASQYPASRDGLQEMTEFLSLVSPVDVPPEERNAVVLSTVHSAKGLEYKVVIVYEPPRFNHWWQNESPEERRIFYVAITRAIERAYVVTDYSSTALKSSYDRYICFVKIMFDGTDVVPITLDNEFIIDLMLSNEFETLETAANQ